MTTIKENLDLVAKLTSTKFKEQEKYWIERLLSISHRTYLNPGEVNEFDENCGRQFKVFEIGKEKSDKLLELTGEQDFSTFIFLDAILKIQLYYYLDQHQVTVQTPTLEGVDGENRMNDAVWLYVEIDPSSSFRELVVNLANVAREAYENQHFPGSVLLEKLGKKQQDFTNICSLFNGLHGKLKETPDNSIFFVFDKTDKGIRLTVSAAAHAPAAFIDQIAEHYIFILANVLSDPRQAISAISYLPLKDLHYLLSELTPRKILSPDVSGATLVTMLENRVMQSPDLVYAIDNTRQWTYSEVNERANQIAHYLIERGVKKGAVIGIYFERSVDLIVSIWGIMKAGGVFLMIDPSLPNDRITQILDQVPVSLMLTKPPYSLSVPFDKEKVVDMSDWIMAACSTVNPVSVITPEDAAYLIFTSGSTGVPKGVMIKHTSFVQRIEWMTAYYKLNVSDRVMQKTPLSFDPSICEMLRGVKAGASLYFLPFEEEKNPAAILKAVAEQQVTIVDFVPSSLSLFIDYAMAVEGELERLSTLRIVITGAEKLTEKLVTKFNTVLYENFGTKLINTWGATEVTVDLTYYDCSAHKAGQQIVPVGKPIDNAEILLLNQAQQPVPFGMVGELYVSGPYLAGTYHNGASNGSGSFLRIPHLEDKLFYKTGDFARWHYNGELEFLARKDDQFKIRGVRVERGDVENQLLKHEAISQVLIDFFKEGQEDTAVFVCYVILSEKYKQVSAAEIKESLKGTLPDYLVPDFLYILDAFPLTTNEKVDKARLPRPDQSNISADTAYVAPQTIWEERLAEIWQELLGKERIGIDDVFFDIGGHSLNAITMITQIYKRLSRKIEIRDVFQHFTIRKLAKFISESDQKATYEEIAVIKEEKQYYPASSSQKRLWMLSAFKEASLAYNVPLVCQIDGVINIEYAQKAYLDVINRHEILRTTFTMIDGEIVQRVIPFTAFQAGLTFEDFRSDGNVETVVKSFVEQPFDLENGPLINTQIIQVDETTYYLMTCLHHIISDTWSIKILLRDFLAFYTAWSKGEAVKLPVLGIQNKDYVAWEHEKADKSQREYWLEKLSGELPKIDLPAFKERPVRQTYNGTHYLRLLSDTVTTSINKISAKHNSTLFITATAIFNYIFHKYTGNSRIILGTAMANRNSQLLENQIGFYVNTIVLVNDIDSGDSFSEHISHTKNTVLEAFSNSSYPFDELVESLQVERDLSRSAIFDVLIETQNYANMPGSEEYKTFDDFKLTVLPLNNETAIVDLNIMLAEQEDGQILFNARYNSDVYDELQIERLLKHFNLLVQQLSIADDKPLAAYHLMLDEDIACIREFNETDRDFPASTIVSYIDQHAKDNKIGLKFKEEIVSYALIQQAGNKIADFLVKNVQKGDYVAVLMDRSPEIVYTISGIWRAGAVYVPVDVSFPYDRIKGIIQDSGISYLLYSKEYVKEGMKLLWECDQLKGSLCVDSDNVIIEKERTNATMNQELWEFVGNRSTDDITGGGWLSSYTGLPLTREDMDEYRENVLQKLRLLVDSSFKVLEIGCSSGITMFAIAPLVKEYHGVDMSGAILKKNEVRIETAGIGNIIQHHLVAHQVDTIESKGFDLIIINSVIQNFHGYNYLTEVIDKCIHLLGDKGYIFVGDVMDVDQKESLIGSIAAFKMDNPAAKTKLDWTEEFFVSRKYFNDLVFSYDFYVNVEHSDKIGAIRNELSEFRYDTLIQVDKLRKSASPVDEHKRWFDRSALTDPQLLIDNSNIDDEAYVIHTSGSTGKPKGAIVRHLGMMNHLYAKVNDLDLEAACNVAQNASQGFDISIWQLFVAMLKGGITTIYSNDLILDPASFLRQIHEDGVTILEVVPSYLSLLLDTIEDKDDNYILEHIDSLLVTGETVHAELIERWFNRYPDIPVVNAYGPTEASDDITHFIMHKPPQTRNIPIGKTVQNFKIYIVDQYFSQCPIGVKGEIVVSGIGVGKGYVNQPDKTKEVFTIDPFRTGNIPLYKTGDVGRYLPDGNIEFFGRKDDQVKVNGHRIELGEIESKILGFNGVKQAVVIVRNANNAKYITAFVAGDQSDAGLQADKIRQYLMSQIPEYMIPSQIAILATMPLNANGKIDRKILANTFTDQGETIERQLVEPRNELETSILNIWKVVLNVQALGIRNSFFENGGNSITAIQVITRIKKMLQVDIPLNELFTYPYVDEFAERLSAYKVDKANEEVPGIIQKENKLKYKISPVQYAEWYLQKFNPSSTFYNIGFITELTGILDIEALYQSIFNLYHRHDVLRTSLIEEGGVPYQVLNDSIAFTREGFFTDIRQEDNREEALEYLIQNHCNNVFDFTKAPICIVKLIQVEDEKYVLTFETHHIIWDQMSTFNFYRELTAGYNQFLKNKEIVLPELKVNYIDYTEWINGLIDNGQLEKQKQYWLNHFKEIPAPIDLPTDFKRPAVHTFNGNAIFRKIDLDFKADLSGFCNQHGITYQIYLISILNLLLHRLSNQYDFVVGTPIWNRDHEHLDKVIGLFASAIPIRCTMGEDWTFRQLFEHTKKRSIEAYEHHMYPFNKVIEELGTTADFSRQKVMSVFFGVQNDDTELSELGFDGMQVNDISEKHILQINKTSVFDFTLQVDHSKYYMFFSLRYNTDLFLESTARRFLERYELLAREALANPDRRIADFNLLTGEDKEILSQTDITEEKVLQCNGIHEIITAVTHRNESAIAIIDGTRQLTYGMLESQSNRMAHYLLHRGLAPGDRIGILLPKSADFVMLTLAVMKTGAAYVPLIDSYPLKRIEEIAQQAELRMIISNSEYLGSELLNADIGKIIVDINSIEGNDFSDKPLTHKVKGDDLVYTIFTSGSTGKPKGIDITHKGVVNGVNSIRNRFGLTQDEVVLFHTAVVFDASIMDYMLPLTAGAKIVVFGNDQQADIYTYERWVRDYGITHIQMVPLVLESIVSGLEKGKISDLSSLKRIAVGGAILYTQLNDRFFRVMGCDLYNCYGPTETTVDAAVYKCIPAAYAKHDIMPVGRPVENTKIYILDNNGNICPIGIPGEMYISSVGIAKGYLHNPEKTAAAFVQNTFDDGFSHLLYKTGDKAEYLEDGNLIVYGRLDNQVKVNGNRVEIEEIEMVLMNTDEVFNAAVLLDKGTGYEQLVAFVELDEKYNTIQEDTDTYKWIALEQHPSLKENMIRIASEGERDDLEDLCVKFPEGQIAIYKNGVFSTALFSRPVKWPADNAIQEDNSAISTVADTVMFIAAYHTDTAASTNTMNRILTAVTVFCGLGQLAVPEEDGQWKILPAVSINGQKYVGKDHLKQLLAEHLPNYMIPTQLVIMPEIKVNASGKNDKNWLKEIKLRLNAEVKQLSRELNDTERKVKQFFVDILDKTNIGPLDSFFDVGGHSINMIQLIAKLEACFSVKIPIVEIFNHQHIVGIAKYIDTTVERGKELVYLYQLRKGGTRNIVCIPSITTSALDFMQWTSHLDGYNVYAFDFTFFDEYEDVFSGKDEIEDVCIAMLTNAGIVGGFDLVGYSAGGVMAYELMKRLEQYKLVKSLTILDVAAPSDKPIALTKTINYFDEDIDPFLQREEFVNTDEQVKKVITQRIWKYSELISYARANKVLSIPFNILSCKGAGPDRTAHWAKLTKGKVSLKELSGEHHFILRNDNAKPNAELIKNLLG